MGDLTNQRGTGLRNAMVVLPELKRTVKSNVTNAINSTYFSRGYQIIGKATGESTKSLSLRAVRVYHT